MENQKYQEEEWDSLLMDCLKKEALTHFETSRSNFDSTQDYFKDLIKFFDNRSLNDEKRFYKDNFRQMDNEPIRSFYLRFLEKTKQLQTLGIFPPHNRDNYKEVLMEDFFFKLNRECFLLIDSKLNDRDLNPKDCDPYIIFDWVENAA